MTTVSPRWCALLVLPLLFAPVLAAEPDEKELARLIKQLGDDEFDRREAATAQLKEIGDPAFKTLKKAQSSNDAEVRRRAAELIRLIENRREIRLLIKQLGDDEFTKREMATARLKGLGEPALPALQDATASRDPEVRRRAKEIIGVIENNLYGMELCLTGNANSLWSISVSADGKRLLTSCADATLSLWDTDNGRLLRVFTGHKECVVAAALSPDGKLALSGSGDKTVRLWDADTGKELLRMTGHTDSVLGVAFAPDGHALSVGCDKTLCVWDLHTGKQTSVLTGHKDTVYRVAYSDKAKLVATSSADRTIRLWNLETGKEVRKLTGHTDYVINVCFSPDGKQLLSSSYDYTVRLWDVATGKELKKIEVPCGLSAALSPDGKRIVTGSIRDNHIVRIWDAETGKELRSYDAHTDAVGSVLFFPDGKRIASASDDRTVRIWRAPR